MTSWNRKRGIIRFSDTGEAAASTDASWSDVKVLMRVGATVAYDQSGRHELATTGGTPSAVQTFGSRVVYSMQYSGTSQYTSAADSADFSIGAGDYSAEAFVRITTLPTSGNSMVIASHAAVSSDDFGWVFDLLNTSGTYSLRFRSTTDGTDASVGARDINATWTTPAINTDYYVAFTRSSGTVSLYAGPVTSSTAPRLGTGSATGTIFNSTAAFVIGARAGGSQAFAGFIGGVRVTGAARETGATIAIPSGFWPIQGA